MRLWHKNLIPYLPRKQLLSQWRECCCIAKSLKEKGTPNHLLVNKILDYPISHFHYYTNLVAEEMEKRGYKCNYSRFDKYLHLESNDCTFDKLFYLGVNGWHNDRYLKQCFYNLQEKYDCDGILESEWQVIDEAFKELIG